MPEIYRRAGVPLDVSMKPPVFVVGCPRSGTTLLYHMLLSSGGFAVYRSETNVFNLLAPRFGDFRSSAKRRNLMAHWLRSKLFEVSGLEAGEIEAAIMNHCHSGGDFLRIVMESVARKQGVDRWADSTPDHLLYLAEIRAQLPGAYVIHIIRDGRDVALSYARQGWSYPLPWDRRQSLAVAGLYWEWIIKKGRKLGEGFGPRYREVRFEELVTRPRETLKELGEFIGHDLDYDRIQGAAIGSVSEPNTSFAGEAGREGFHPVSRWKSKMSAVEIADFEGVVGGFLSELGYPLAAGATPSRSVQALRLRATYLALFETKHWLRTHTPLGRLSHIGRMMLAEE